MIKKRLYDPYALIYHSPYSYNYMVQGFMVGWLGVSYKMRR